MQTPCIDELLTAFPVTNPPEQVRDADRVVLSTFEGQEFLRKLRGRVWTEIANEDALWEITSDPLEWLILMPTSWSAYYLPALLTVAIAGTSIRVDNLRGFLYLALTRGAHGNGRVPRHELTDAQNLIIERFLVSLKHGRLPKTLDDATAVGDDA